MDDEKIKKLNESMKKLDSIDFESLTKILVTIKPLELMLDKFDDTIDPVHDFCDRINEIIEKVEYIIGTTQKVIRYGPYLKKFKILNEKDSKNLDDIAGLFS